MRGGRRGADRALVAAREIAENAPPLRDGWNPGLLPTTTLDSRDRRAGAPRLLRLALPITLGQLAVVGMSVTDVIVAGQVGANDLAGVTLGGTVFNLAIMLIIGIVLGNGPIVGQLYGARDREGLRRQLHNCLWLSLPLGAVAVACMAIGSAALDHIDTTDSIRAVATGYLLPMLGAAFLMPFLLSFRTTFEGMGHVRPAMVFQLLGFVLNIPLDFALVLGWWGLPALGGAGCGWATLAVMLFIVVGEALFARHSRLLAGYRLLTGIALPQWRGCREILRVGLPIGGAILAEGGFFLLIPLLIAHLGAVVIGGHAVAISFDWLMFMIPLGIGQAISVQVAHELGRGQPELARRACLTGLGLTTAIALVQAGLVVALREPIAALFTTDRAVRELAAHLLLFAAAFRVFDAINVGGNGALRGYQDTGITLVLAVTGYWLVGFPLAYSLALTSFWGPPLGVEGFWIGMVISLAITSALTSARLLHTSRRALQLCASDAPG